MEGDGGRALAKYCVDLRVCTYNIVTGGYGAGLL